MKIQDQTLRAFTVEVQPVNAHPRFYIKVHLPKGYIVFELKVGVQLFGLKDEPFLEEIDQQRQEDNTQNNIKPERHRVK
jgi:hypothetical protein